MKEWEVEVYECGNERMKMRRVNWKVLIEEIKDPSLRDKHAGFGTNYDLMGPLKCIFRSSEQNTMTITSKMEAEDVY